MSVEHSVVGWLTEPYDYQRPRRGQMRKGVILRLEERGAIIDVGLKRDGFVPQRDIERLGEEAVSQLESGQEVMARIVRPRDRDGDLILSLYQARLEKDWVRAQELLESGQVWQDKVTGYNRGGVLVKFGHIRGFVPASHLWALDSRHLPPDQRQAKLQTCVGQELSLKVIEVDRDSDLRTTGLEANQVVVSAGRHVAGDFEIEEKHDRPAFLRDVLLRRDQDLGDLARRGADHLSPRLRREFRIGHPVEPAGRDGLVAEGGVFLQRHESYLVNGGCRQDASTTASRAISAHAHRLVGRHHQLAAYVPAARSEHRNLHSADRFCAASFQDLTRLGAV